MGIMTTLNERIGLKDLFETIIKVVFFKEYLIYAFAAEVPQQYLVRCTLLQEIQASLT